MFLPSYSTSLQGCIDERWCLDRMGIAPRLGQCMIGDLIYGVDQLCLRKACQHGDL
jgi:hypothetical protein